MINLAMEIPQILYEELTPLCDFEFCLAQEVLASEEYAEAYAQVGEGHGLSREVIMDNGFHELGRPLSVPELVDAAARINPNYVIAPDMIDDLPWTYGAWKKCVKAFKKSETQVLPVLTSAPELDQKSFLMNVEGPILCLPYRRPRLSWVQFHIDTIVKKWNRIHLLGVSEPAELEEFVHISKPVKWGLLGNQLDGLTSWRRAPIRSADIASVENVTPFQKSCIYWNVAYLRRFTA
jgi:hypothetical protein